MPMEIYIIRIAEIFLKGKNKKEFEKKLIQNMNLMFEKDIIKLKQLRERIVLYAKRKLDLKRVFGVSSYSNAIETEYKNIKNVLKEELSKKKFKSFRISSKRINKNFEKTSIDINKEIGQFVVDNFHKKVSLENFDLEIGMEVIGKKAYLFFETENGFGGLPVGVEGRIKVIIENKKSILAALLMMKRGCCIEPIFFKKVDIKKLQKYSPKKLKLKILKNISLTNEQVVSGETLEDFKEDKNNLILRPLIAFSEDEINKEYRKF